MKRKGKGKPKLYCRDCVLDYPCPKSLAISDAAAVERFCPYGQVMPSSEMCHAGVLTTRLLRACHAQRDRARRAARVREVRVIAGAGVIVSVDQDHGVLPMGKKK